LSQWGNAAYAQDIEVLDGDGTSFLVTTIDDAGAAVWDNMTRRPTRSGIYTVDRIERTTTPGVFVGYENSSTGFRLSKLNVTASGVTIGQSVSSVISGFYVDIKGAADHLVSSSGLLVDSATLSLRTNLGVAGRPAVDAINQRAYIVNGNSIRAFETSTGASVGNFPLGATQTGDWAQACVRWGSDGLAVLGSDSKIYIARWSSVLHPTADNNGNLISDAWELDYFGSVGVNTAADNDGDGMTNAFEFFHGTSPLVANGNPLRAAVTFTDGGRVLHIIYPRRAQLIGTPFAYETSVDLRQWDAAAAVTETVLATQIIDGVQVQTIDAAIPSPVPTVGFGRLKWLGP